MHPEYDSGMISDTSSKAALYWAAAILAGGLLGGMIYTRGLDWHARHGAQNLCHALRPGMSLPDLRATVTAQGGWLDLNNLSVLRVGTDGWHSQCRCSVSLSGNSVTGVSRVRCTQ